MSTEDPRSLYGQHERGPPKDWRFSPQGEITVNVVTTLSNGQRLIVPCRGVTINHAPINIVVNNVQYNEAMIAGEELAAMASKSDERFRKIDTKKFVLKAFWLAVLGAVKYYLWQRWR